jgi:hypothetical protein
MNLWPFYFRKWENRGVLVKPEIIKFELQVMQGVDNVPSMRDSAYRAIPHKDFMELVARYRLNDGPYVVNRRDCDKYAIFFQADVLRGWADCSNGKEALAFGYMGGVIKDEKGEVGGHGWIWQRDDKGIYRFIQGQSNTLMTWDVLFKGLATG